LIGDGADGKIGFTGTLWHFIFRGETVKPVGQRDKVTKVTKVTEKGTQAFEIAKNGDGIAPLAC
jgi:hypothetical protein